jgi:hypothetical protein
MRQLLKITSIFALALVFTAGMAYGQTNNRAEHDQTGDDHVATSTQTGADNTSLITQDKNGGPAANFAEADVDQTGDDNYSRLRQTAFFGNSTADVDQVGNNNSVRLKTSNGGGTFEVYMEGNNNILGGWRRINAENGPNGVINNQPASQKNQNFFDLDIDGDNNRVGLKQESAQSATVSITGSGNLAPIFQKDPGSTLSITADGSNNRLEVFQGPSGGFGVGSGGNDATIELLNGSDFNNARIAQTSANNLAEITIDGSSNESIVKQQP